jgi:hypothetical protein
MSAKQKRFSYSVALKLNVIKFAKEHSNMAAERHFGPHSTEKMIRDWRKQKEELLKLEKNIFSHTYCKMAQARIRGEEVDNGPQKQWQ